MNKKQKMSNSNLGNEKYCSCIIISTNILEKGVVIQKRIEDMLDQDEEIYFMLYKPNFTNLTIGNSIMTFNKINNGKLHTDNSPQIIIENKHKKLTTMTGLLIKNITNNLVLHLSNSKFLENTKSLLHVDCTSINKRQSFTLNYILTSTNMAFKNLAHLIFYIISFWYESKIFLNDAKDLLHTTAVIKFVKKPTTSSDLLLLLIFLVLVGKERSEILLKNLDIPALKQAIKTCPEDQKILLMETLVDIIEKQNKVINDPYLSELDYTKKIKGFTNSLEDYYILGRFEKSFHVKNEKNNMLPFSNVHPTLRTISDPNEVITLTHKFDSRVKFSDEYRQSKYSFYAKNKIILPSEIGFSPLNPIHYNNKMILENEKSFNRKEFLNNKNNNNDKIN